MTLHRDTIPSVAKETDAERKKIVAAMRRLLIAGKPRVVALDDRLVIDLRHSSFAPATTLRACFAAG